MNQEVKYIGQLLEKYFGGITSLEEEEFLRNYFQQDYIPESLKMYRPMFNFFSREIEKEEKESPVIRPNYPHKLRMYWISASIAACFLLFAGIRFLHTTENTGDSYSQVYIDGKKYTDIQTIQSQTLNSLENISESGDEIIASQIDMLDAFTE